MAKCYHVITLHTNGSVTIKQQSQAPSLAQLQAAVGGYIERIPYFTKYGDYTRGSAYANEEGLLKALPHNALATGAWRHQYSGASKLVGDVIFYAKAEETPNAKV